jgi:hypothetical protein
MNTHAQQLAAIYQRIERAETREETKTLLKEAAQRRVIEEREGC